jgi:gas vesicle protein
MEGNNGYGNAVGWLLVGSVAGACAALLLAPETGKKTRERLARRLRDTQNSVTEFTGDLADTTRNLANKAGRITDKAVRLAGGASAAARDVMGSLNDEATRAAKR